MGIPARIELYPEMFAPGRRLLLSAGGIVVRAFRYPSGVAALEVDTGAAQFILLPFQGQQIWDAVAGGRRLTMRSVFDAPLPTRDFRRTYGGFFLHCGGTGMGHPGPEDSHAQHGEMPNMPFESASLIVEGDGVALAGLAHDREAFAHAYAFRPELRFSAGSARVVARVEVENQGGASMPFMYLGHVNFCPQDGARIVDSLPDDSAMTVAAPGLTPTTSPGEEAQVRRWHDEVARDPVRHRIIAAGDRIEPEFVALLPLPAGPDGWTHAFQLLPDGSGDFVSYRPADLPLGVRWLTRARERQALGLVLPATAAPDGREAARRAGTLRHLAPGDVFRTEMHFGALTATEVAALRSGGDGAASED
ncbi:MAG: DUF4432 family protein [Rubellimicrobium sp.]|nr:DUF4432 family protein [Rubellimicrobium sp.]